MSDYESIMICTDKLKFYEKCKDKFPLPKTYEGHWSVEVLPLFVKPRIHSVGSRGVKVLEKLSDVNCIEYEKYDYIFQGIYLEWSILSMCYVI